MNRLLLAREFLTETIEAFVIILLFQVLSENNVSAKSLLKTLKISMLVGGLTTVTFVIDQDSHGKIKDGMKTSIGASVVASALGVRRR